MWIWWVAQKAAYCAFKGKTTFLPKIELQEVGHSTGWHGALCFQHPNVCFWMTTEMSFCHSFSSRLLCHHIHPGCGRQTLGQPAPHKDWWVYRNYVSCTSSTLWLDLYIVWSLVLSFKSYSTLFCMTKYTVTTAVVKRALWIHFIDWIPFHLPISGKLFHIDFGYILGRDPKPLPPPMKLSKEMVEGMGGMQSEQYQEFRKQCYTAFLHLRR